MPKLTSETFNARKNDSPSSFATEETKEIGAVSWQGIQLLGRSLAAVACVVNPEAFVIGGGMSKAGAYLLDKIQYHFRNYAFHASRETEFQTATLGNNAGIFGSIKMLLE